MNSVVGAVYCVGQGGDQGTRALVNNLKGGTFTNPEHTEYTWGSEENVAALKALYDNPAIAYDPGIAGGDEIALFYNGTLNVAFCWNIAQQLNPNSKHVSFMALTKLNLLRIYQKNIKQLFYMVQRIR